ncbi:hypothetical protein D3C71_1833120 [compost metagenome]
MPCCMGESGKMSSTIAGGSGRLSSWAWVRPASGKSDGVIPACSRWQQCSTRARSSWLYSSARRCTVATSNMSLLKVQPRLSSPA